MVMGMTEEEVQIINLDISRYFSNIRLPEDEFDRKDLGTLNSYSAPFYQEMERKGYSFEKVMHIVNNVEPYEVN